MRGFSPLDVAFDERCREPSDIFEHLPTLRRYAAMCRRIVEFGVRTGVSTFALLHGQPDHLVSYDLDPFALEEMAHRLRGATDFSFVRGSTLEVEIEPTDMLFIDSRHTYEQLSAEFARHANKVRDFILLHDTETFGVRGEDGREPGLKKAVIELVSTGAFRVREHHRHCNGLTVIERVGVIE